MIGNVRPDLEHGGFLLLVVAVRRMVVDLETELGVTPMVAHKIGIVFAVRPRHGTVSEQETDGGRNHDHVCVGDCSYRRIVNIRQRQVHGEHGVVYREQRREVVAHFGAEEEADAVTVVTDFRLYKNLFVHRMCFPIFIVLDLELNASHLRVNVVPALEIVGGGVVDLDLSRGVAKSV